MKCMQNILPYLAVLAMGFLSTAKAAIFSTTISTLITLTTTSVEVETLFSTIRHVTVTQILDVSTGVTQTSTVTNTAISVAITSTTRTLIDPLLTGTTSTSLTYVPVVPFNQVQATETSTASVTVPSGTVTNVLIDFASSKTATVSAPLTVSAGTGTSTSIVVIPLTVCPESLTVSELDTLTNSYFCYCNTATVVSTGGPLSTALCLATSTAVLNLVSSVTENVYVTSSFIYTTTRSFNCCDHFVTVTGSTITRTKHHHHDDKTHTVLSTETVAVPTEPCKPDHHRHHHKNHKHHHHHHKKHEEKEECKEQEEHKEDCHSKTTESCDSDLHREGFRVSKHNKDYILYARNVKYAQRECVCNLVPGYEPAKVYNNNIQEIDCFLNEVRTKDDEFCWINSWEGNDYCGKGFLALNKESAVVSLGRDASVFVLCQRRRVY